MLAAPIEPLGPLALQITPRRRRLLNAFPIISDHSFSGLHMRGRDANRIRHRRRSTGTPS
jgi:hypothetical protein